MKKYFSLFCVTVCLAAAVVWQLFSDGNVYLISVIILIISMLPFLFSFENSKPDARLLALTASLIGIAVVSRAVFYLLPQVKPIGAIVIISGVCLGAKKGYLVGVFSAFISNFIFGQGVWTPFQMVALGLVGFMSGLIFRRLKADRISLSVAGFLLTAVLYGVIVDTSSVLMMAGDFNFSSALAVYAAGIPFSLIFGITTAACLFVFGKPFINKITRLQMKYGIK